MNTEQHEYTLARIHGHGPAVLLAPAATRRGKRRPAMAQVTRGAAPAPAPTTCCPTASYAHTRGQQQRLLLVGQADATARRPPGRGNQLLLHWQIAHQIRAAGSAGPRGSQVRAPGTADPCGGQVRAAVAAIPPGSEKLLLLAASSSSSSTTALRRVVGGCGNGGRVLQLLLLVLQLLLFGCRGRCGHGSYCGAVAHAASPSGTAATNAGKLLQLLRLLLSVGAWHGTGRNQALLLRMTRWLLLLLHASPRSVAPH